ncbi:hypothetical protein CXG81DRAFT_26591 [Caulochytrium protostelioides]|uniref:SLM1/RGC1-like BAR-like domain-containing protein n=1 Tax=Caulochytrium protostelioides TaxID=1555241 RepID=A0A4P9X6C4_9FUNG|nr:hypothetical protein CXG81DRAFT_26591 [Caulochytrium protostelioides]|eukprot:RKP00723.1 hypothetical protein CXG81DRAFT_26591 [Caulochytrium protostelioides]
MSRLISSQNRAVAPMGVPPTSSDFKSPIKPYDDGSNTHATGDHESKPLKTKIKEKFGAASHDSSHDHVHADDTTTLYTNQRDSIQAPGFYQDETSHARSVSPGPEDDRDGPIVNTSQGLGSPVHSGQMSPTAMESAAARAAEQFRTDGLGAGVQHPYGGMNVPPMPEMPTADIGRPYRNRTARRAPSTASHTAGDDRVNASASTTAPAASRPRASTTQTQTQVQVEPQTQAQPQTQVMMASATSGQLVPHGQGRLQLTAPPEDPMLILLHRTGGWNRFLSQFIAHLESLATAERAAAEAHDSHYGTLIGHEKKQQRRSLFGGHARRANTAPSRSAPVTSYNAGPTPTTPTMAAMTSMAMVPGQHRANNEELAYLPDNLASMSRLMGESHKRHVEVLESSLLPRLRQLAADMNQCHSTLKKARRDMASARSEERHAFQDAVEAYHASLAAAQRGLGHFVHDPSQGCDPWMYRLAADSAMMRMHNRHTVREAWCESTVASYLAYDRDTVVRTVRDCVAQYHRLMTPPTQGADLSVSQAVVRAQAQGAEDFTAADDREAEALRERIAACPKVAVPPSTYPERRNPLANAVHCGVLMTQGGPKEQSPSSSAASPGVTQRKSGSFWSRLMRTNGRSGKRRNSTGATGAETLLNGTHTIHRGWTPVFAVVSAVGYLHLFPGHAMPPAWTFTSTQLPLPTASPEDAAAQGRSGSMTDAVQPIFGLRPMNGSLLAPDGTARIPPTAEEVEHTRVLPFSSLYIPQGILTPAPTAHASPLGLGYAAGGGVGGSSRWSSAESRVGADDSASILSSSAYSSMGGSGGAYAWHEFHLVFHPPSVPPTTAASRRDRHKQQQQQQQAQTFRFRVPSADALTEDAQANADALSWRHVLGERALVTYEAVPKSGPGAAAGSGTSGVNQFLSLAPAPQPARSSTVSASATPAMTRATTSAASSVAGDDHYHDVAESDSGHGAQPTRIHTGRTEVVTTPPPFAEDGGDSGDVTRQTSLNSNPTINAIRQSGAIRVVDADGQLLSAKTTLSGRPDTGADRVVV